MLELPVEIILKISFDYAKRIDDPALLSLTCRDLNAILDNESTRKQLASRFNLVSYHSYCSMFYEDCMPLLDRLNAAVLVSNDRMLISNLLKSVDTDSISVSTFSNVCQRGDMEIIMFVEKLIRDREDHESNFQEHGCYAAARTGNLEVMKYCLDAIKPIEEVNRVMHMCLGTAVSNHQQKIVEYILSINKSLLYEDLIITAATFGNVEMIKMMLEHSDVNELILHLGIASACYYQHYDIAELLKDKTQAKSSFDTDILQAIIDDDDTKFSIVRKGCMFDDRLLFNQACLRKSLKVIECLLPRVAEVIDSFATYMWKPSSLKFVMSRIRIPLRNLDFEMIVSSGDEELFEMALKSEYKDIPKGDLIAICAFQGKVNLVRRLIDVYGNKNNYAKAMVRSVNKIVTMEREKAALEIIDLIIKNGGIEEPPDNAFSIAVESDMIRVAKKLFKTGKLSIGHRADCLISLALSKDRMLTFIEKGYL
jgi:hypothetical protein